MNELKITTAGFMPADTSAERIKKFFAKLIEGKKGFVKNAPNSFDEMTEENILFLGKHYPYPNAYAILNKSGRNMDVTGKTLLHKEKVQSRRFLTYCFTHFFGISKDFKLALWCSIFLNAERLMGIIFSPPQDAEKNHNKFLFSWLFKPMTGTKVLVTSFILDKIIYKGPCDKFRNMVNDEFNLADRCYLDFLSTGNEDSLNLLIAALYREIKDDSTPEAFDQRFPFDRFTPGKRAAVFKDLPVATKKAILINYMAIRNYMIATNPSVFSKGGSNKAKNEGWGQVILDLAAGKSNVNEIRKELIWDTFEWIAHLRSKNT